MQAWRQAAEQYFGFAQLETTWRREAVAGLTTFAAMAYIIAVNSSILGEAGLPVQAAAVATCLAAAFGSILMGAWARYPIALAPGMGLNAYFTYTVVKGLGVPWQTALGAVFLSGLLFLVLTATGVRQLLFRALPVELHAAVAVGIGLFIALIGLQNAGLVVSSPATLVTLGDLRTPRVAVSLAGLLVTAVLLVRRVPGGILLGIVASAAAGAWLEPRSTAPLLSEINGTWLQLDIGSALRLGVLEIIFVFLFVDLFDNLGTLVAVGTRAGLFTSAHDIPRLPRILFTDAAATTIGSLLGTSTVVSYIESAAGVVAGGRSGVTAIVVGLLFLLALPLTAFASLVPVFATAPTLILVGALMANQARNIAWDDYSVAIPAFLLIVTVPLTFSIATGLAFGIVMYTVLRVASGAARQVHWATYLLTVLFVARFVYLGGH